MAGPNLELFKFGLYLFFPLAIMVHYGDPEWYHQNVLPIRDAFWPKDKSLYKPPRNTTDLQAELAELRQRRLERRDRRVAEEGGAASLDSSAPSLSSPARAASGSSSRIAAAATGGLARTDHPGAWKRDVVPDPTAPSRTAHLTWDESRRQRLV